MIDSFANVLAVCWNGMVVNAAHGMIVICIEIMHVLWLRSVCLRLCASVQPP
jgi:hypothetical protein